MPTSAVRFILSYRCAAPCKIATPCDCVCLLFVLVVCVASAACIGERRFGLPPGQKSLACVGTLGLDKFVGNPKIRTHLPFAVRALPPFRPMISAHFDPRKPSYLRSVSKGGHDAL